MKRSFQIQVVPLNKASLVPLGKSLLDISRYAGDMERTFTENDIPVSNDDFVNLYGAIASLSNDMARLCAYLSELEAQPPSHTRSS